MTDGAGLRVTLHGDLAIAGPAGTVDGSAVRGRLGRVALAFLVLAREAPVGRDALADALWDGVLPRSWESSLDAIVSRCRSALTKAGLAPTALTYTAGSYHLDLGQDATVDVHVAEDLVAGAGRARVGGDPVAGATAARDAVVLLRPPFLVGDSGDWVERQREAQRSTLVRAMALAAELAPVAEWPSAVGLLEEAVAVEPFREDLHRLVMQVQLRAGNRGEALRAYERCRTLLAEELGVSPSPETEAVRVEALGSDEPSPAARGIVCLLFTDLVGSTELLERLGEADAEVVRRIHFRLLRDAITSRSGHEVKNLGDGLMVVFPSAADAVGCAVAIQQSVASHNRRPSVEPLAVRVGLHVGEPIRDEDDYFGMPVNVAKRLCDRAGGGQILASSLVRELLGERAETWSPVGELKLKGLQRTVSAWTVPWDAVAHRAVPLPAALTRSRGTFVGRTDELALLGRVWERTRGGQVELAAVSGEPGIGKTTLVTEFAAAAHRFGAVVLFGRCDPEPLLPYQPFVEAFRHLVRSWSVEELRRFSGRGLGDLALLLPDVVERTGEPLPADADGETRRWRIFDTLAGLLAEVARAAPVVVVLDDLHWADQSSLLMLRHLVEHTEPSPVLLVGTYRESELSRRHPLADALAELRRHELVERIPVGAMDEGEVALLLDPLAGQRATASAGLARMLVATTEGNPFFVHEIVHHLLETGRLHEVGGGLVPAGRLERIDLPEGVREVIGRRLDRLSPETNRALATAAIIGRDFDLDVLAAALGDAEVDVIERLDEAVTHGAIIEVPCALDRYSFSHALLRETVYDEIPAGRRVRTHRQIAAALEALHDADPLPPLAALAYHHGEGIEGGDARAAVEYARRAGDAAMANAAFDEAADLYERALAALEHTAGDKRVEAELLLAVGESRNRARNNRAAYTPLLAAAALARELDDTDLLVRAALGFSYEWDFNSWRHPAVVELARNALDRVPEGSVTWVMMASHLAWLRYHVDLDEAYALARRALAVAALLDDPQATSDAALGEWELGPTPRISEKIANIRALRAIDESLGRVDRVVLHHTREIGYLIESGDLDAVADAIHIAREVADELRSPVLQTYLPRYSAMRATLEGRFEDADRINREAVAASTGRDETAFLLAVWRTAHVLRERGQAATVIDQMGDAMTENTWVGPRAYAAVLYHEAGQIEQAAAIASDIVSNYVARGPRDDYWPQTLALLAELPLDADVTRQLDEGLAPFTGQAVAFTTGGIHLGAADWHIGRLATRLGRLDEAEQHLAAGLAQHERWGAKPFIARTHLDQARLLLARDDEGAAAALATTARAEAEALGMAGLVDDASSVL